MIILLYYSAIIIITTYDIWAQARHTLPVKTSKLRPHPLSGKIICVPAHHSPYKAAYQI